MLEQCWLGCWPGYWIYVGLDVGIFFGVFNVDLDIGVLAFSARSSLKGELAHKFYHRC